MAEGEEADVFHGVCRPKLESWMNIAQLALGGVGDQLFVEFERHASFVIAGSLAGTTS
jgi:hypothetical protein